MINEKFIASSLCGQNILFAYGGMPCILWAMNIDEAVNAFGALAQETRLKICKLLVETGRNGLPAGDISLALGIPQNTLSFHLSHLQRAGLIRSRRAGRFIIYSPDHAAIDALILYLAETCREKAQKSA